MDQTQLLDWDREDGADYSSDGAGDNGKPPKPVGRLHLLSSKYGPEKDFWIYPGENVIGRLESCQICLPVSSVSKAHAVIEVPSSDGPHLLYDRDSLNRTRRQRMVLIPQVRYSLQDGDTLLFGDVGCQYFILAPGSTSDSPDDSMEVPPTQPRVDASALVIEETPAPGKRRMGFGGILVQDSDREEEEEEAVNKASKLQHLPRSDGSYSSIKDGTEGRLNVASSMFSSPSATVVPESDEESEEPSGSGPSGPSLRLSFDSPVAEPGPSENGAAATPSNQERHPARAAEIEAKGPSGDPTAKEQGALKDPIPIDIHLDSDTDVEDEAEEGSTSEIPVSRDLVKENHALEVGSDTDTEEPVAANPDVGCQKDHHTAIDVGSDTDDTDVEEAVESAGPAENGGGDTDVEETTEHPSAASFKSRERNHANEDSCKGVEGAGDNPDVAHAKDHPPDESDTDAEEAADDPSVCLRTQRPAKNEDSDIDMEETPPKGENPDGSLKAHKAVGDSDADTDVEGANLETEDPDVAIPHGLHSTSCKDSSGDVQEIPSKGIALHGDSYPSEDSGCDNVQETKHPSPELQRSQRASSEQPRTLNVKEPMEGPEIVEDLTALPQNQHLPMLSVDSDTDEEKAGENPDVDSKGSPKTADAGPSGRERESLLENPALGPQKGSESRNDGDSDTDVEATSPSLKEPVAHDSDTDVEEVITLLPGKPLEEQDTQLVPERSWVPGEKSASSAIELRVCHEPYKEDEDTDGEGHASHPEDESNTDGEDSSCALEEEPTQMFDFRPPSAPAKFQPGRACSSPLKDDDSDPDVYMLEATQPFCKEPGQLSEEATQAFVAEEEEDTELISQHPPEGEDLSEQTARTLVPVVATRVQQAGSLTGASTQPYSIVLTSSEPVLQSAGGSAAEEPQEAEETQPVCSVPILPVKGSELLVLQKGEKVSTSQEQVLVRTPEDGSTAEISQSQRGAGQVEVESVERSSTPAGEARNAEQLPVCVTEEPTKSVSPAPGRRRSLRSSSAAASPASVPEGRSRLRGHVGSGDADGSSEPVAPVTRRRGLRQLSNPAEYLDEPKRKTEQPEGEEASRTKKPKNGEPTVAVCQGRVRHSQGESSVVSRPKEEKATTVDSPGTREPAKREQRRTATKAVEERQAELPKTRASRRSGSASVTTPSPKDSGKAAKPRQEPAQSTPSLGRRLRRQSTENQPVGTRAQPRNRAQGSGVPVPKVLFTGVIDEEGEHVVTELGGSLAESVFDCTHLVTDRVRRTVKFLCALARGIPIVTLDWLEKSRRNSSFLVPSSFLVHDPEQEKKFCFSLTESLQRARQEGGLLQGYEIHVTPNVQPEPEHMKDIVKCSGGTFLPRMPRAYKDKRIVISCPEDLPRCKVAQDARIPIANSEFILTGILQQKVDLEAHQLDGVDAPRLATPAAPITRASKRRAAVLTAPAPPSTAKRRR
ncbi:mediator of DNA damage checkpoint protein 1 isoform X2 [Hemicordylus capensis]|uniref:mediator of DNA damage checkpoint protein 1 isoform X2 n=1 Tax=Hemicordylus capensis TaxID=884348 RepID=UPI002303BCA7|nr:mediator of DNA damage checkpoint protein 1 isoform X2 [Hemicordylus capensis]